MSISESTIAKQMISAARKSLGRDWKSVRQYVEMEMKHLAQILANITKLTAAGEITKSEAVFLFKMHRQTTEIILITAKGVGLLAVERAINAALAVVKETVNSTAGLAVL